MKFVLFWFLFGFPIAATAQHQGYDLDAWFWDDHLSTRDSFYTQDVDVNSPKSTIPVHLSISDFEFIDSAATSVGFWTLPDTLYHKDDTSWKDGKMFILGESIQPSPGNAIFKFTTPLHQKSVEIISWPIEPVVAEKISKVEDAIMIVIMRQSNYNTPPRKVLRY
jgi:hypothetical protein